MSELVLPMLNVVGFIFQEQWNLPSGMQALYDYGPVGIELKKQPKAAWAGVRLVYDVIEIERVDAAICPKQNLSYQLFGHEDRSLIQWWIARMKSSVCVADSMKDIKVCDKTVFDQCAEPAWFSNFECSKTNGPVQW